MKKSYEFQFRPVTIANWPDLVAFFRQHGKPNYCWCMRWRLRSSEFRQLNSAGRKDKMEELIRTNTPVGILGYYHDEPVGWCSIAPRETYRLLENSTSLKRIDRLAVWSIVCFFVDRAFRNTGFSLQLLRGAVDSAILLGATVIEGYPVEKGKSYRFMGSPSLFKQAGFRPVAVTGKGRLIVRLMVDRDG